MPSGAQRKVQTNRFAMTPRSDVPRSAFDVQHGHKTTFDAGYLIPCYVDEVLPGDSMRVRMHAFARLATPIVPVMDNLIFETFFFFVPNRLVWTNWERFMGEQDSPTDITDFVTPQIEMSHTQISVVGSVADYMGITVDGNVGATLEYFNALPFRAYNLIWNEWFRDQDLQVKVSVPGGDGPDGAGLATLLRRSKRHDYFTTCRPWPAKPVMQPSTGGFMAGDELRNLVPGQDYANVMYNPNSGVGAPISGLGVLGAAATAVSSGGVKEPGQRTVADYSFYYDGSDLLMRSPFADGQPDVKVLINDIRTANMLQQWMERNARGGTRYAEILRSHFGVTSPDARLQRPEFLGSGRSYVTTSPVAQTSASGIAGSTTVLGEQAAIGTLSAYNHGFSQSFTEHGFVIGLMNIRADLSYQQGVNRMWFRKSKFDYYWPQFGNLAEQAVFSKEIFNDGSAGDDTVFGYQERYSEYKYKPSRVSSHFRSSSATPLDMWHFAQNFAPRPVLNANFIIDVPPIDRALQAVFPASSFLCDMLFETRLVRCMAMYGIPGVGMRF